MHRKAKKPWTHTRSTSHRVVDPLNSSTFSTCLSITGNCLFFISTFYLLALYHISIVLDFFCSNLFSILSVELNELNVLNAKTQLLKLASATCVTVFAHSWYISRHTSKKGEYIHQTWLLNIKKEGKKKVKQHRLKVYLFSHLVLPTDRGEKWKCGCTAEYLPASKERKVLW